MSRYDAIIADLKTTLETMVDTEGVTLVFSNRVGIYDDLDSFLDVSDSIKARTAGIIVPAGATRVPPLSNDEEYAERLPGTIAYSLLHKRTLGDDEGGAMAALQSLGNLIRAALMVDASRGGNANLVNTGGAMVNGTSVDGDLRILGGVSNEAVYTAEVPFTVAWWIARSE